MSTNIIPYLDILPVELLYHLLNYLDTNSILLSFRYVCKRFYLISNVYDEYKLNLNSCNKSNFYHLCRIINPLNIIELTLSDDDQTPGQINLFFKFFNIKQFHSLRSLTLLDIDDTNLNPILNDLSLLSLTSLTIKSRTFFTWTNQTLISLSTILEQSSLKHFTVTIWCFEIYDFLWPNECYIEYLHISNRITFEQYCIILDHCLILQKFVIKDVLWNDTNIINTNQYRQLKCLTLEDNRMDIFKLDEFLSLTPSLIYLKVIGMAYLIDCDRWEKILRTKLPNLNKFEFFFLSWKNVNYDFSDIDSLIKPFQTSFWLETKQWIVNCDYIINPTEVMLYSIPICKSYIQYHEQSNKISCSNFTKYQLNENSMDKIKQLRINLSKITTDENPIQPLFRNVNELILDLDDKCLIDLSKPFSNLINLLNLTHILLNINYDFISDIDTTKNLNNLFKQTLNLQTFEISNNLSSFNSNSTIEDICLLIPTYIQHLKLTVNNINDMKVIYDHFEYISSITFCFSFHKSIPSPKIIESFLNIKKDLTYRKDDSTIRVWLNPLFNDKLTQRSNTVD